MTLKDWWKGQTPGQKRRQSRVLAHPILGSLRIGTIWGVLFGLLMGPSVERVITAVVMGNLFFGPWMVFWLRRKTRKDPEVPSDHA